MISLVLVITAVAIVTALANVYVQAQEQPRTQWALENDMFMRLDRSYPCSVLFNNDKAVGCNAALIDDRRGNRFISHKEGLRGDFYSVDTAMDLQTLLTKYQCDYEEAASTPNSGDVDVASAFISLLMSMDTFLGVVQGASNPAIDLNKACIASILIKYENLNKRSRSTASNEDVESIWNTHGTGLSRMYLKFPVVFLTEDENDRIESLAPSKELDSKHQVHARFYMGPKNMTSPKCLSIKQCLPIGGLSVWGILGHYPTPTKKMVLGATKLDSSGMFHDIAFGASSAVSGIVALLAAAEALSAVRDAPTEHLIAFAFFKGESFDRTGSMRFIKDIVSGEGCREYTDKFNISCYDPPAHNLEWTKLSTKDVNETEILQSVVVVDQVLAELGGNGKLHVHCVPGSQRALDLANDVVLAVSDDPSNWEIHSTKQLPIESTLSSFTSPQPWTTDKLPLTDAGIIISGYDDSGFDRTFNSIFDVIDIDNPAIVDEAVERIFEASTTLSRTLFTAAVPSSPSAVDGVVVKRDTIRELLNCFLKDFACELVAETLNRTADDILYEMEASSHSAALGPPNGGPISLFTGTYQAYSIEGGHAGLVSLFVRNFLAKQTGVIRGAKDTQCDADRDCAKLGDPCVGATHARSNTTFACVSGVCACTRAWYHDAWSAGLKIGDGVYEVDESSVSIETGKLIEVWTEPYWLVPEIFVYAKTNNMLNWLAFGIGLLIVAVSMTIPCSKLVLHHHH